MPSEVGLDAFAVARGNGRPIHVLGNDAIIKISSRDTGGAFTVFEAQTQPLAGPPMHRHGQQDEYWYILEGEFKFEVDGREIHASTGATVFAPRGSRHTFQNVGNGPGRTLTTVIPGGIDLFFEELESSAPRGSITEPAKLMPIFKKYGQELLGPPMHAASSPSSR